MPLGEQAVLRTSSFLLNDNQTESWMDLPQATQSATATRLLSTVEDSAYQVAQTCREPKTIVNVTLNIGKEHLHTTAIRAVVGNALTLSFSVLVGSLYGLL